ncbi:MAG: SDR family NAD(P)-dependent oxidoreductase [Alphaproteobacteria bacterium]|nr:SDR family NAD(P)-dependent oxidoreductase [Alphaproteobacteria bacterium]
MDNPRHILITGSSSGLGAALALAYAGPGIRLALHGRNAERLAAVAAGARQRGAATSIHSGDVADAPDMAAWIAACDTEAPIDLVIANAGISAGTGKGESAGQVQNIFATNVGGVFNTIHPLLAPMALRGRGQIVLVSSIAGFRGFPGAPAYCASKAAVRVYGEGLRGEMARHKIEVNVVCPGFIKTPMTDTNNFPMPFLMSAERAASVIKRGLACNRARIAFPWPMYLLVRLLAALPQSLMDKIAAHTPRK